MRGFFAAFFPPAFPWGKGAGAAFFAFGAYKAQQVITMFFKAIIERRG